MVSEKASFSAECRVGRLLEARLGWVATAGDVHEFQTAMRAAFTQAGPHSIICADWRQVSVLPPEASDALIGLLRVGNRHFVRSAVLLHPGDAMLSLQVERLFREAANPDRRAFRAPSALLAWLGEVLTPAEARRAWEFLDKPSREQP